MGYDTRFTLNLLNEKTLAPLWDTYDSRQDEIMEELREKVDYARFALCHDGVPNEPAKWYEHEMDFLEFSKKYPDVIFQLSGEGEEAGDLWIKYFKNGKMQKREAKITYESYDEKELE